jgi:hypothetical protein
MGLVCRDRTEPDNGRHRYLLGVSPTHSYLAEEVARSTAAGQDVVSTSADESDEGQRDVVIPASLDRGLPQLVGCSTVLGLLE